MKNDMSSKTIQIFLTDADINGVKIADLSNSTARVYVVPRDQINYIQSRPDLSTPALYMLFDDERTTVYVGESESFQGRVSSHLVTKDFWKWAVVCIAHGEGMDKAQVKFLESHAVQKAIEIGRFNVQNRTSPVKNNLHEFRLAETLGIFEDFEMLVTTLGFNVFEPMKDVSSEKHDEETATSKAKQDIREYDTIICPATGTGLVDAFQKKSAWWAVRIGQENISKFKYVGLYEGAPISAIRYYARITGIEPYPDKPGKYLIHHDGNIIELQNHIVIDKHPELCLFGPRYYKLEDILHSKSMAELTDRAFGSSYQGKSD